MNDVTTLVIGNMTRSTRLSLSQHRHRSLLFIRALFPLETIFMPGLFCVFNDDYAKQNAPVDHSLPLTTHCDRANTIILAIWQTMKSHKFFKT